jgi:hypothetical protein
MSLEIQDEFAASFAKYSYNLENWQAQPGRINHVFQDWFSAWLEENKSRNLGKEYTNSPHPEHTIREMFGKFFSSLRMRNHVAIPKVVREAAIQEYLED